jgi:hypothetical protein
MKWTLGAALLAAAASLTQRPLSVVGRVESPDGRTVIEIRPWPAQTTEFGPFVYHVTQDGTARCGTSAQSTAPMNTWTSTFRSRFSVTASGGTCSFATTIWESRTSAALTRIQQDHTQTAGGTIRIPRVRPHGGFVMRFERRQSVIGHRPSAAFGSTS